MGSSQSRHEHSITMGAQVSMRAQLSILLLCWYRANSYSCILQHCTNGSTIVAASAIILEPHIAQIYMGRSPANRYTSFSQQHMPITFFLLLSVASLFYTCQSKPISTFLVSIFFTKYWVLCWSMYFLFSLLFLGFGPLPCLLTQTSKFFSRNI